MVQTRMLAFVCLLGIVLTTKVGLGSPITTGPGGVLKESQTSPILSPVVHAAVLYAPKNESYSGEGNGVKGILEGIQTRFSSLFNSSSSKKGIKIEDDVNVRVLNSTLATSPADVNAQEGGLTGLIKGVSSTVHDVRSNVEKALFGDEDKENDHEIVWRNGTMIVARVAGSSVRLNKVYMDGSNVMVVVDGEIDGSRNRTKEYRIKIDGKYEAVAEKVYLKVGGDEEEVSRSFDIVIPQRKRGDEEDGKRPKKG